MKTQIVMIMAVLAFSFTVNCCLAGDEGGDAKPQPVAPKPEAPMVEAKTLAVHVLKIEGNKATTCPCKVDCKCSIDYGDETQCTCGKKVSTINVGGKYCCIGCNKISDNPGKCSCGTDMEPIEK